MARLHEHQAKAIFEQAGIRIPNGKVATSPDEVYAIVTELDTPVVIKAQVWVTGRAGKNLVHFVETPDEARSIAEGLLGRVVNNFRIDTLLIEEQIAIQEECYLSLIVDDEARAPMLLFSRVGGSGIEDILHAQPENVVRHPVNIRLGLRDFEARDIAYQAGFDGKALLSLSKVLRQFYTLARERDARSAEINPLVLTQAGEWMALDGRMTVDDYAVYRQPDLNIEIAREFDHPPTPLEQIAWEVEKHDYRGTFYFIQMEQDFAKGEGVIGFHGSGGGGSMMNMDALQTHGYRIANFIDTSGESSGE